MKKKEMGELIPLFDMPAAPKEEAAGQVLFALVIEQLDAVDVTLPRSVVAVAVRHGVAALADGVEPEVVLAGCIVALRQNKARYCHEIIADIVLAKAGQRIERHEYENELRAAAAKLKMRPDEWQAIYGRNP